MVQVNSGVNGMCILKPMVVAIVNEKEWLVDCGAPWYVDFVIVHNFKSEHNLEFPVYYWIGYGDCVTCTAHTSE